MATDRISIEIILDDGSIQKGFANIEKKAKESGDKIGKNLFDEISDNASNFARRYAGSIAIITGSLVAAKVAFETALEGEKINAINRQFEVLAQSQGIAANALKDSLSQISAGLIDDTNLSKIAASAIVTLGDSAARLPEILEISRKAAFLLGKDFESTFNTIVNSIENGNAKSLKNLNIIIDSETVYRNFAKTLGLTAGELNQTQKQQALLNAVIDQGAKSFKNVDTELTPLANAFQRLKVTIGQNLDDIAVRFSNAFGGGIAKAIDLVNEGFKSLGPQSAGDRLDDLTQKLIFQQQKVNELRAALSVREESKGFLDSLAATLATGGGTTGVLQRQVSEYDKSISEIKKQIESLNETRRKSLADEAANAAKSSAIQTKLTADQVAAINNRATQIASANLASQNVLIGIRESALQFETDFARRREERALITSSKLALLEQETSLKILEINKQFSSQLGFTESQREQLRTNILAEAEARRALISQQGNEALTNAAQKSAERISLITSAVTGVIRNGAVALGESLSQAGNSFENFGKSIIGVIADQIIALGQGLIVQGLAIEAFVTAINSLLPGSGAAAAAAGLGLVLFGTALKAAVGAGGEKSSPSAASAGGGVGGGTTEIPGASPISDISEATPQEPNTKIELNIQGDVLDSEATGLRIVDLLNSAFDKSGVVVTGAV